MPPAEFLLLSTVYNLIMTLSIPGLRRVAQLARDGGGRGVADAARR
jgi:hypothetical protein